MDDYALAQVLTVVFAVSFSLLIGMLYTVVYFYINRF